MSFTQEVKDAMKTMPKEDAAKLAEELRVEREANEADGRCTCGNHCSRKVRMFHAAASMFVELSARKNS
jgi:hypothetical protein